ncbi:MAG TPA: hypothetical protein VKH37_05090, partial [Ferruginibacter sp.]|nr:hypothetical protein [Ferruginibacter sp.]
VGFVSVTNDSTYIFPITNYQASIRETRTAGDNSQVSEVIQQGNYKFLYRLKVDENALKRRNVNARPTEYVKRLMEQQRITTDNAITDQQKTDTTNTNKDKDFFQNEFENEKKDSSKLGKVVTAEELPKENPIKKARVFEYRPPKFFVDYAVSGFNNSVFGSRYQPYAGGTGPVSLSNGDDFNGLLRMGTSDLFEDVKFNGGFRLATSNLSDYDVLFSFMNYRKRLDWGAMMYRTNREASVLEVTTFPGGAFYRRYAWITKSNLYLLNFQYPFDRVRSVRAKIGPRFDRLVIKATDQTSLEAPDLKRTYGQFDLEYVHDNTINPALNIWKGLRWK